MGQDLSEREISVIEFLYKRGVTGRIEKASNLLDLSELMTFGDAVCIALNENQSEFNPQTGKRTGAPDTLEATRRNQLVAIISNAEHTGKTLRFTSKKRELIKKVVNIYWTTMQNAPWLEGQIIEVLEGSTKDDEGDEVPTMKELYEMQTPIKYEVNFDKINKSPDFDDPEFSKKMIRELMRQTHVCEMESPPVTILQFLTEIGKEDEDVDEGNVINMRKEKTTNEKVDEAIAIVDDHCEKREKDLKKKIVGISRDTPSDNPKTPEVEPETKENNNAE